MSSRVTKNKGPKHTVQSGAIAHVPKSLDGDTDTLFLVFEIAELHVHVVQDEKPFEYRKTCEMGARQNKCQQLYLICNAVEIGTL